jgi:hypothetical protein
MKHRTKYLIAGLGVVGVVGAGAGIGVAATSDDDEAERSITGVEVTLSDGTQVDVQLDENFAVVGVEDDDLPDDD